MSPEAEPWDHSEGPNQEELGHPGTMENPVWGSGDWGRSEVHRRNSKFAEWGEEARAGNFGGDRLKALGENGSPGHAVTEAEAGWMYWVYWTTDLTQQQVGVRFGRDVSTVMGVVNRDGRYATMCEAVAARLGYPEQRDWHPHATRRVDP